MAATASARVLADSIGPGGTAAIVVLVLVIACVVIILAMLGSLKRLKQSVSKGTFQQAQAARKRRHKEGESVTPDPGGPGGADA